MSTQLYLPLVTPIADPRGYVTTPWQLYFQNLGQGTNAAISQLTGDVTAGPGGGSQVATIANSAVSYAKMQNVSAASKLLGRGSAAGAGVVQEITLGTGLSMSATTLNSAGGDVTGPASATADAPVLFNGTTGKLIKNSTPTGTGNPVLQTSPTLTTAVLGSSTATTQAPADNSTKVATTAYVDAAVIAPGYVVGPASATADFPALFNGTTGTKVYYVSDTNGGPVDRKLTFLNGLLTAET